MIHRTNNTLLETEQNMFKYETHIHTKEASACGVATGRKQALQYKKAGYDGIIITDHFFGGNTRIPPTLPWEERINRFCLGYEHAKETGDQIGLKVFFGYEQTYEGTDFLIYGVDKEWMLKHREIEFITIEEQYKLISSAGGMVIQAHPFRERHYIPKIRLFPNDVDGVEVKNYGNTKDENKKALEYAKKYNLPMTCGSDGHHEHVEGGGIGCYHPLETIDDYINLIKNREEIILL